MKIEILLFLSTYILTMLLCMYGRMKHHSVSSSWRCTPFQKKKENRNQSYVTFLGLVINRFLQSSLECLGKVAAAFVFNPLTIIY